MKQVARYVERNYWNDAMSWDDPIHHWGWKYTLVDGSVVDVEILLDKWIFVNKEDEEKYSGFELASVEEIRDYYRRRGYIFIGDEVEVKKGRTLPIGSKHIVKGYKEFAVAGTYGHEIVKYLYFTDGTKISIKNVKTKYCDNEYLFMMKDYKEESLYNK